MRVYLSEQTCAPSSDSRDNEVGQDYSLPSEQPPADVYTAVPLTFSSEICICLRLNNVGLLCSAVDNCDDYLLLIHFALTLR